MRKLTLVAITACWLAVPGAAAAQSEAPRQEYDEQWTTHRTDASTGRTFNVDFFDPSHPKGKPPAIERILVRLHPGTRFDTAAVPRCAASDAELTARGTDACPPRSTVGEDRLVVDTGVPGPGRFVTLDSNVFNAEKELIFLAEERDSGARFVVRAAVDENTLDIPLPFVPGAPPDGAAPTKEDGTFPERSTRTNGRRVSFLTTPSGCPRSGEWTNRVTYFYRDGVVQTAESTTPCTPPPDCRGRRATIVGARGDDELRGTRGRDVIVARGGDDAVRSRGGDDLVCAGRGADHVRAGRGGDRVYGGGGNDELWGNAGRDRLRGAASGDELRGGRGRDELRGHPGPDRLHGGSGSDRCAGGSGHDDARGCEGSDRV